LPRSPPRRIEPGIRTHIPHGKKLRESSETVRNEARATYSSVESLAKPRKQGRSYHVNSPTRGRANRSKEKGQGRYARVPVRATGSYPLEGTRSIGGTTAGWRTPVETPSSGLVAPVANADGLNPLTISHTPMNSSHWPPGTVTTAVDRVDRPSPTPYVLWTWRKASPMMYATMTKGSDHGWPDGGRFALLAAPPKRGWRPLRKIGAPCAGLGTANTQPAPRSSRRRPPGKQHPGWDSRARRRSFRFGSAHHEAAAQPKLAWAVFRRSHPRGLV
jgi:hypothetical protein